MTEPATPSERLLVRALSAGQEAIDLQQQASGSNPIFNVPAALRLTGSLDVQALNDSFTAIVARHDVLRTTFDQDSPTTRQVVMPAGRFDLPLHDLSQQLAHEAEATARHLVDLQAARPFELRTEPGLRAILIRLDDEQHVLCWVMHHIVCDGWSKSIFAQELSSYYAEYHKGGMTITAPQATYGDFVAFQQRISPKDQARHVDHWIQRLRLADRLTGILTDHPRRPSPVIRAEVYDIEISTLMSEAISNLAHAHKATPFIVLYACLVAMLHRVSGENTVIVNTPYSDRPTIEFESVIGFFVDILPICTQVDNDMTFEHLLRQVRHSLLTAYEHHRAPMKSVLEQVWHDTSLSHEALHQLSFSFLNLPYREIEFAGICVEKYPVRRVDIRYEIELTLWDDDTTGGIGGRIIYRPDLFEADTIRRLLDGYLAVIETTVHDPSVPISNLPAPERSLQPGSDGWSWDLIDTDHARMVIDPRTPTESFVKEIFSDLLHFDTISIDDNFLEIGGNSFLISLMATRIRDMLSADISVRKILHAPTIEAISAAIDREKS
ncbi:condensation domain-containing protein [Nocardia sp. NPDC056952]|uniref:condensation domain-containing protein n=1 Tax=Nocardia sp. NPDC056952 TaxID=3345979 RepID=UPI00364364C9